MKIEKRACSFCGIKDIPFGVDWPWWCDGKPVHEDFQRKVLLERKISIQFVEHMNEARRANFERKTMEHEHLYHKPTPISDNEKIEFVPLRVARELERSTRELCATNFELQNQNILIMQAFRDFVMSTEKFISPSNDHQGWSGAKNMNKDCPVCVGFSLALATAKFLVKP
jgi:hypothetical protein